MENNFGFLFKKSSLPKSNLNALLSIEEFVSSANEVIAKGKGIEDADIYNIVKGLYFPMLKDFETNGFKEDFKRKYGSDKYKEWSHKFRTLGSATRSFSKALYGGDQWSEDYNKFKNEVIV